MDALQQAAHEHVDLAAALNLPPNRRVLNLVYVTPGGARGRGGMGMMARYLQDAFCKKEFCISCKILDSYGPGRFSVMPFYFAAAWFRLAAMCMTRRVDVVHIHMSYAGSVVRKLGLLLLANLFGVPTVLHLHGSEFALFVDQLSPLPRRILVAAMSKASRVVVIGSYWQRFLVETLNIEPARVVIIHNGVPLPQPVDRTERLGPLRILCLGLLGQRKGTSDLLHALVAPELADLSWRAVIAGNGDVARYQSEAERLGLADRVELPGWVDAGAVAQLLKEADIFILPSYNEGLPVAVLEAMAAGLPVITTPVGAIPDLVTDGQTGLLVQPGAVVQLSSQIARLLSDRALCRSLGQEARQLVSAQFTVEGAACRLASLYREVSAGAPVVAPLG